MLIFLIRQRQQYYSVIEKGTGKSDKKFESSLQSIHKVFFMCAFDIICLFMEMFHDNENTIHK